MLILLYARMAVIVELRLDPEGVVFSWQNNFADTEHQRLL